MADLQTQITALQATQTVMQADYNESLDTIWMLLAGLLVFFMHAGFSLLEAGSVRFKNTQNILSKNLLVVTIGFLCWWATGWSFAYGVIEDPGKFMGSTQFFMDGFWDDKTTFRNWFFQGAFCATAGTIVSGAMAERTQLKGLGIYAILLTAFIYPAVAYWGWSGVGFLYYTDDDGEDVSAFGPWYRDFAGSGIVHLTGGIGALVGSICVGPRKGRFESEDEEEFASENVPFIVLGTFALWFGWYGFNPGSQLAIGSSTDAEIVGRCAVTTTLSGAAAGLTTLFARKIQSGTWDLVTSCNGALAGLVAITAGPSVLQPWAALIAGAIGALVFLGSKWLVLYKLKVDDPVDAIALHGFTGAWGLIVVGLLADKTYVGQVYSDATDYGIFYGGEGKLLGAEIVGIICIFLWVMSTQGLLFFVLSKLGLLRASADEEMLGLDASEHGGSAYNYGDAKEKKEQI